MLNQVTDARVRRVSFVDRAATRDPSNPTQPRRMLLWKSEDAPNDPASAPKGGDMPDMTPDEMRAALTKAEEERDTAAKERDAALTKAEEEKRELEKAATGHRTATSEAGPDEDPDEDDLSKADLPEPVKVLLAKRDGEVAELRKRAESAEEIAKAERDQRQEREWIAKAEKELPHIGAPDTVGKRMKRLSETMEKSEFEEFQREQAALNAQLAKADTFGERGHGGPIPPESGGVSSVLAKAEELEKADPSLSPADAFRRAAKDPAVQSQYARERA